MPFDAIMKTLGGAAMVAAVTLGAPTGASAAILANGEFMGLQNGAVTTTNANVPGTPPKACTLVATCYKIGTTTTSVTVATTHFLSGLSDPFPDPGGIPNNLITLHGGSIPTPSLTTLQPFSLSGPTLATAAYKFNVGAFGSVSTVSMTMKIDTYTFLFTTETVLQKANKDIQLQFDGNLTTDSAHHILPTPAELLVSFAEQQPKGLITVTYLLDVPPGGTVPEPISIAVLGVGLLGLGWARRRA